MTALAWLRQDLRLADNSTIGLRPVDPDQRNIIPIYLWAPEEEGDWPPGAASRWWLHQSLTALAADLEKRGSRLIIRRGPSLQTLEDLIAETGAEAVYWNRRYEPAAIARDRKVEKALRHRGITVETFNANLLFEPGTVLNSSGEPFRVFTAFWRATQKSTLAPPAPNAPRRIPAPHTWPKSLPLDRKSVV